MHFLSVLTARVCWPSATVRVAPLYRMCGSVAYFVLLFCTILQIFVKSLQIVKGFFCMNPDREPRTATSSFSFTQLLSSD